MKSETRDEIRSLFPRVRARARSRKPGKECARPTAVRFWVAAAVVLVLSVALGLGCGGGPKKPTKKPVILRTQYDDKKVGDDAAKEIAAQMGFYGDPALSTYVSQLGTKLVRYAPLTSFKYSFMIVDQPEPNAFALPGGHIYVSRGLLALTNSEDELANVIGHEITHSAARHAAAQQEIARRTSPLAMPYIRMAEVAAYGREQERDADQGGQFLANAAGYNPMGMSTFLRKLGNVERQKIGYSRLQGYFDTHPGSSERAATAANRAQAARTQPTAASREAQAAYLRRLNGLVLGTNPAEGIFKGNVFVQPDLGFHMRFPSGWRLTNSHQAVGASSPRGNAIIFLMVEGRGEDAKEGARAFVEKRGEEYGMEIAREGPVKIGEIDAWRIEGTGWMQGQKVAALLTFVPFRGLIYRITAVSPPGSAEQFAGRSRAATRSFGPMTKAEVDSIQILRLRVVSAEEGETLSALGKRTQNAYSEQETAILNGFFTDKRFREGELVKIAQAKPYRPSANSRPSGD